MADKQLRRFAVHQTFTYYVDAETTEEAEHIVLNGSTNDADHDTIESIEEVEE